MDIAVDNQKGIFNKQNNLAFLIFTIVLYFLYSTPLHTTYHFEDEAGWLFRYQPNYSFFNNFFEGGHGKRLVDDILMNGRPVSMSLIKIMSNIVNTGFMGLQFIRWLQLLVSLFTASLFYWLLRQSKLSFFWTIFLVVAIWTQPVFQTYHVYWVLTPYLLGVWSSFLAFYILCRDKATTRMGFSVFGAFLLLLFSCMTFQATPFAGLALMIFFSLNTPDDSWHAKRYRYLSFIAVLIASILVYTVVYKMVLALTAPEVAPLTERSFSILSGELTLKEFLKLFHPRNYTGPFEFWNYLFPISPISSLRADGKTFRLFAYATMLIFCMTVAIAFILDFKRSNRGITVQKYLIALFSLGLTFIPLIADGFRFRQYLYVACTPAIVLILAYCTRVIFANLNASNRIRKMATAAALSVLILIAAGAQANVYRGIVLPNHRFLQYVENEMLRQIHKDYNQLLVINAQSNCPREPCRGIFYNRMCISKRTSPGAIRFYRRTLQGLHMRSDVAVQFTDNPDEKFDDAKTLVIDFSVLHRKLEILSGR